MKLELVQVDASFPEGGMEKLNKFISKGWHIADRVVTKDRDINFFLIDMPDPYYGKSSNTPN